MDVLADVLHSFRLKSTLYCRADLHAPWSLGFAPITAATFHVVDRGSCWLEIDGDTRLIPLADGDLIVLPHGIGHGISHEPHIPRFTTIKLDDQANRCEMRRNDGTGKFTTLLCGIFAFEHRSIPLLELLPPLIHIKGEHGRSVAWLDTTLKFLANEAGSMRPGSDTIIKRLADILFIQVVRAWLENEAGAVRGWLGALRDPQIGAALARIHQNPERAWTVGSLASEVAMSRSSFAARFGVLVGEPPLHYITRWRMHIAARLLQCDNLGLAEVAQRIGYVSEVAFRHAFKREMGVAPGVYRRAASQ